MKKDTLAILFIGIFTAAGLLGMTFYNIQAASQTGTTISVTVGEEVTTGNIDDISMNGETSSPVITYNANNSLIFYATGAGTISVLDHHGNTLFSKTKSTTAREKISTEIKLKDGVGTYYLTLRLTSNDGGTAEASWQVIYKALPTPPATGSQTGGYSYIGGYAVSNIDVFYLMIILLIASCGVLYITRSHKPEPRKAQKLPKTLINKSTTREPVAKTPSTKKNTTKKAATKKPSTARKTTAKTKKS